MGTFTPVLRSGKECPSWLVRAIDKLGEWSIIVEAEGPGKAIDRFLASEEDYLREGYKIKVEPYRNRRAS